MNTYPILVISLAPLFDPTPAHSHYLDSNIHSAFPETMLTTYHLAVASHSFRRVS